MPMDDFDRLTARVREVSAITDWGRVSRIESNTLSVAGLGAVAARGRRLAVRTGAGEDAEAEILRLSAREAVALCTSEAPGMRIGDPVRLLPEARFCPDDSWIGRVIDPGGAPLDGRPLRPGPRAVPLAGVPPPATLRRGFGERLGTGLKLFNTLLPLVRGQRVGLFAGAGIGKSTLIGQLARRIETDVVVIALVGERGRELGAFIRDVLGPEGMARAVVVAATSDQSPLQKRRAAEAAMAVAEHFRDRGKQVLLVVDSITRFAEAHREVALAAGEPAAMRGWPPSLSRAIMSLCERAGPGAGGQGDITAVYSVLVAGSDMDEPVADILRGVLDGHVVLSREIAERGRFPAVDVLRSVSRSLPAAASDDENAAIEEARRLLGAHDSAALMIRAGLYEPGADPLVDRAVAVFPALDDFFAAAEPGSIGDSFAALRACLETGSVPQPADQ